MTEEKIDAFAPPHAGEGNARADTFRRAYHRSVVDQIEVDDDEIRIRGRRYVQERLVMSRAAAAGMPSFCMEMARPTG
ncbi:hypothetical protein J3P71_03080 [Rhizobium leguminosarum]|uniref:hypothetical protein n=1 Tax=Rhizobium leguminosarum TaxID=384 RepID=UPI0014419D1E|nr:hypothetical protein [Rhizobium leguminosarum]MBY5841130.1 hypothetical protein [Rhizobium leguminosarum]NKM81661.1 hypothetical protein [Rhizobium leguminosarum bv. viciae]QSZ08782.1 hypothetical protein J3P71_03080 [Rhizobium leguminosarum]